jgi:hypothetical protein
MAARVEDAGESERRPVTGRTGAVRTVLSGAEVPRPERAQTSGWSFLMRDPEELAREEKQMNVIRQMMCASSGDL